MEPALRLRDVENRHYDPLLKSVVQDMCRGNHDKEDCFTFNYDTIDNRISSIKLDGNTYYISGLYNAWSMSFTRDEHLANNLETKNDNADKLSITMNSCETNYFSGDRMNIHLRSHVFWYDLRCIDYVKRGVDNYTAEETIALSNPICSSDIVDADGDGWGWENDASCVVGRSANTKANSEGTVSTNEGNSDSMKAETNTTSRPNCTSNISDPDGDGWGWENEASCKVVSSTVNEGTSSLNSGANSSTIPAKNGTDSEESSETANVNESTNTNVATVNNQGTSSDKKPDCVSANSDPDGDGWGWENGVSCKVVARDHQEVTTPTNQNNTGDNFAGVDRPVIFAKAFNDYYFVLSNKICEIKGVTTENEIKSLAESKGKYQQISDRQDFTSHVTQARYNKRSNCTSNDVNLIKNYLNSLPPKNVSSKSGINSNDKDNEHSATTNNPANNNDQRHPTCVNAKSDPDGDGWGWENEASCIVN